MYELFAIWHSPQKASRYCLSMLEKSKMLPSLEVVNGIYFDHKNHEWLVFLGMVDGNEMIEVLEIDLVGSPVELILEHFEL
jgi:hypothetical protein